MELKEEIPREQTKNSIESNFDFKFEYSIIKIKLFYNFKINIKIYKI